MNPTEVVEALWAAFDRFEFTAAAPLLHDAFVFELPQSGEVIRGGENFIAMNQHYPGQWRCTIQQLIAEGDKVVTETRVSDGNQTFTALSFFTFKDGQIIHLREYWPDPMPAQDWRAQWVENKSD